MKTKQENIFEMLSDAFVPDVDGGGLEACFSGSRALINAVPLRCRLLALGFLRRLKPREVNALLTGNGCPALYPRSFRESTLIYAYENGLGYEEWKRLLKELEAAVPPAPDVFAGGRILLSRVREYVQQNSSAEDGLRTGAQTVMLGEQLRNVGGDREALRNFYMENAGMFSGARERTRYYFCKYLLCWLDARIENYFAACRAREGIDEALEGLLPLKVVTKLRRGLTAPEAEKRAWIEDSVLSCGELFTAFTNRFLGYPSLSWSDVLLEGITDPDSLDKQTRKALADTIRKADKSKAGLDDAAVIRARLTEEDDGKEKSRTGELTVYKYLQGTLDIGRTVLLCFLLFFSERPLPEKMRLNEERIAAILDACGYPPLDTEDDLDWFVTEYLISPHPDMLLQEFISEYASRRENSFLYRLCSGAVSYGTEVGDVLL